MDTDNGNLEKESKEERTSEKIEKGEDKGNIQNQSPAKPKLRASTAILIFILYLAGQVLTAIFVTVFEIIKYAAGGGNINQQTAIQELISDKMPLIVFVSAFGGAIALAAGAYAIRKSLQDNSLFGAAWTVGKPKVLLSSFILGVCAAFLFFIISISSLFLFSPASGQKAGLLAQMAGQSGFGQFTVIIFALFMAPLIEELLFRGILLGGLNRSFGIWWGVVVSNLLFISLHYSEAIHFWPAFIGIGLLSATATRQRLTQNAIGPAIAVHFGYNLMILGIALIAKITGGSI